MKIWQSAATVERAGFLRMDSDWLRARWEDASSWLLLVDDRGNVSADHDGLVWGRPAGDFDPERHIFLGVDRGVACFAHLTHEAQPGSLRDLGTRLPADEVELAFTAAAVSAWVRRERFCPRCGGVTDVLAGGFMRRCRACGAELFPRHDPAMIVAVTDDEDRLLLAHQASWAPGRHSILAGFLEAGESLEQCVAREVAEEVGIKVTDVTYAASQPWPFPRSLMLAFRAHAATTDLVPDGSEIASAGFFTRSEVAQMAARGDVAIETSSVSAWLIKSWLDAAPQH